MFRAGIVPRTAVDRRLFGGEGFMRIIEATKGVSDRRRRVDAWIASLTKAEDQARSKVDAAEKLKPRSYLINYRIGTENSAAKGTEGQRRSALVEMIQSLRLLEKHISTSTWLVIANIQDAKELSDLLCAPLDADLDGLHVTWASASNRATFGETGLES